MERSREITVKGVGSLKVSVDYVVVNLALKEIDKNYEQGYANFQNRVCALQKALVDVGFNLKEIKTKDIAISTKYDSVERNGEYKRLFSGYAFSTSMLVRFDFDSKKLTSIFSSVAASGVKPEIDVDFTVKDEEAVKNMLLACVAKDAKAKALALCEGMGVKLGKLLCINYNWDEIIIHSSTRVEYNDMPKMVCGCREMDFTPDDIPVEDEASFVWEIVD